MEINDHKGKRHLYLDRVAGIADIMKRGWDLLCSTFPVDALRRRMDYL